jgi:hypothetical protein
MEVSYVEDLGAAMLAAIPVGESPTGGTCSVATVVISGGGKGDRPVESPEVKVPVGWEKYPVRSARGASKSAGRSECKWQIANQEASKTTSHRKRMMGYSGVPNRSKSGEGQRCR